MTTDEALYRCWLDGDEEAVKVLVERYDEKLTLYINGIVHDIHDAEDLMVEAYSQLFRKPRPINREGGFKAYLYKTGRHLALRYRKKACLVSFP